MKSEICLEHIKQNMYRVVDCQTGNPTSLGKKGTKRAPSKYNLHMKECLRSKSGPIQSRFKECAAEYKRKK